MRIPRAATVLIEQVQGDRKRAKAEPVGEPDGFGVQRTISFDKPTSKWLDGRLSDPRIISTEMNDGRLEVTFTHRVLADQRTPFALSPEPEAESEPDSVDGN